MLIDKQVKPALISNWVKKAFNTFYPEVMAIPTDKAPNSFAELKAYKGKNSLPVFDGACDFTIYNKPEDNIVFRAWHDSLHLSYNLSFSLEHEKAVGMIHCEQLRLIKAPTHVINAVYFDVVGQIEFYAKYGDFVQNQKAFVQCCLDKGLEYALSLGQFYKN